TVSFAFFDNGTCAASGVITPQSCELNVPLVQVTPPGPGTAGVAAVDNSTCTRTPGVGLHSYQATYNGDALYPSATSACEPFEILQVASHVTTKIVRTSDQVDITNEIIDLNGNSTVSVQDVATVTCDGGQIPSGTVTFTRFSDGACTGTPTI